MEIRIRKRFNPTNLDCEQWAQTLVKAGMKGVILTAKHHDGFCLWPFEGTDYSVKNSPWKNGQGNVVKELSEACKKYGLKFAVYLSPWDRHQANYGTPEYLPYFYAQLHDLLTNYGPVFEVWFDGANGGDGWYGGAKDIRTIDRKNYYNYPRIYEMLDSIQPQAIIFSDGGPGCRWVGNEKGFAGATNWSSCERERCIRDMIRAMNCSMDIRMEISGCLQSVMCLSVRDGSIIRRKMTE